jgi:UDP-N-acetylmuramate dehydrogenase
MLIERSGLKGTLIGGAVISEKHANFIVNTGNATSTDIYNLIQLAKETVLNKTGILLEEEVRCIGVFGN